MNEENQYIINKHLNIMETNNVQTEEMIAWLDEMPKYLRLNGGEEYFVPIIYKHEWDGHDNAWFAMFAKKGSKYFNPTNCVICVEGCNFLTVVNKLHDEVKRLSALGVIAGKEYHPENLPEEEKNKRYAYDSLTGRVKPQIT